MKKQGKRNDLTCGTEFNKSEDDYNDSDIVSAQDREQVETFLNSAHIMVMEGMLCRVFGVEYSGETCG